jgi:hypothetical protein
MTKTKFKENFNELIPDLLEGIEKSLDKVCNSGAVDFDNIPENTYGECKNVLIAILQNMAEQYKPHWNKSEIKKIKNYYKFT